MNRNIKKQFYVNEKENKELKRKADLTCLTEAALIRQLVNGYLPKEKPDERFYEIMNQITEFADGLEGLVSQCINNEDAYNILFMESGKWNALRSNIEEFFLRPERSKVKWQ